MMVIVCRGWQEKGNEGRVETFDLLCREAMIEWRLGWCALMAFVDCVSSFNFPLKHLGAGILNNFQLLLLNSLQGNHFKKTTKFLIFQQNSHFWMKQCLVLLITSILQFSCLFRFFFFQIIFFFRLHFLVIFKTIIYLIYSIGTLQSTRNLR